MNSSVDHQKLIEEYASDVSLHLKGVPPQESLEMLDEVREVLHAKLMEDETQSFNPVQVLGEPAVYALRLLDAAGYSTSASYVARKSSNRKRSAAYAVLLIFALVAIPLRIIPSISDGVSNILKRVPFFGVSLVALYGILIVIFLVGAFGGSITEKLIASSVLMRRRVSRLPLGSALLRFLDQLRPLWWFLRAWTLAILISHQSDPVWEKHYYPVPSLHGHRPLGLLLLVFLVAGSFALGNHFQAPEKNAWLIPLLILNVILAFMFSVILFSQADFNNLKQEQRVTGQSVLGTQVGAPCTEENEAVNRPGISAGTLFCLKTSQGLFWHDFDTVTGNAYLNSVLPSCDTSRYTKATLTPEMIQLAKNYFKEQNLLPVEVTMVGEAVPYLSAEGIRACSNGVGIPIGAYRGFIPKEASAGWAINVVHKMDRFGNNTILKIVKVGDTYKIVDVGSSP